MLVNPLNHTADICCIIYVHAVNEKSVHFGTLSFVSVTVTSQPDFHWALPKVYLKPHIPKLGLNVLQSAKQNLSL
jgi:hypothetical protein